MMREAGYTDRSRAGLRRVGGRAGPADRGMSAWLGRARAARARAPLASLAAALVLSLSTGCDPAGPDFDEDSLERLPEIEALSWAEVEPAQAWDYWELRHAFPGGGAQIEILGSGGPVARSDLEPAVVARLDEIEPIQGFATSCLPAYCFDFVAAVDGDDVVVITTPAALHQFLGDLDNVTEAVLLVHAMGYYWEATAGTGYREAGSGWELVVLELVGTCAPVQTDRVLLMVPSSGPVAELGRAVWARDEGVCI